MKVQLDDVEEIIEDYLWDHSRTKEEIDDMASWIEDAVDRVRRKVYESFEDTFHYQGGKE